MKQIALMVSDTGDTMLNNYLKEGWKVVKISPGHNASTINWLWLVILEK